MVRCFRKKLCCVLRVHLVVAFAYLRFLSHFNLCGNRGRSAHIKEFLCEQQRNVLLGIYFLKAHFCRLVNGA